ncbi:hypothetical protein MRB53_005008 [Persea americana]|uniref:Uncharacterized protein n=1 Tax=Persea americana TaxID=3435 RepID=A0ACC2MC81_PERAE|nr:hypothetical protein MRB53_005008 [Persea americana]
MGGDGDGPVQDDGSGVSVTVVQGDGFCVETEGNTGRWVLRGDGKYREMGSAFCVETVMQGDGFCVLCERNGDAGKDWR